MVVSCFRYRVLSREERRRNREELEEERKRKMKQEEEVEDKLIRHSCNSFFLLIKFA